MSFGYDPEAIYQDAAYQWFGRTDSLGMGWVRY